MTTNELITKAEEAIAACLDQVSKRAAGQEANAANNFATAAQTACHIRQHLIDYPDSGTVDIPEVKP